jgi:hypothetical protein
VQAGFLRLALGVAFGGETGGFDFSGPASLFRLEGRGILSGLTEVGITLDGLLGTTGKHQQS